jgi:L-methionine (R)-S-oxide reductase
MAESIIIDKTATKTERYQSILPQIEAIIGAETDQTANMANIAAILKEAFGFFWVGFYVNKGADLVLGPFQGPLACTRIAYTRGVCGHAYTTQQTVLVPDVEAFPGHIACSSASQSEIVIPGKLPNGTIAFVLDVDSDQLNDFDQTDQAGLEAVVDLLVKVW